MYGDACKLDPNKHLTCPTYVLDIHFRQRIRGRWYYITWVFRAIKIAECDIEESKVI